MTGRIATYQGSIKLRCEMCGVEFERGIADHRSRVKRGSKVFFCGLKCSGRYKVRNCFKDRSSWKKTGKKIDELSPFRSAIKKCKSRKKWITEIDAEYIKEIWDRQGGKCALSGIDMLNLPEKLSSTFLNGPRHPFKPSLDRIDSSKGYVKGNVQWVCTIVNLAKADFAQNDFLRMCVETARRQDVV